MESERQKLLRAARRLVIKVGTSTVTIVATDAVGQTVLTSFNVTVTAGNVISQDPSAGTSSTKGATGHCFGAAGAIEAIFTTLALKEQIVPPTINLDSPDPECDLDFVPNTARAVPGLETALSNSFGFGGHNATLVLRRAG